MKIPFGLAARLAVSFVALALLSQWLNYRSSSELRRVAVHQREVDKIKTVARFILPRLKHEAEAVAAVAQLVEPELARAMQVAGQQRTAAIAALLDRAYRQSGVDLLEVTDAQGVVIYRAHEPARHGDLATTWGVEEALAGTANVVGSRDASAALVLFIAPLRAGERVIGTLSAGMRIDDNYISTLSSDAGAELALLDRRGAVVASSHGGKIHPDGSAIAEAFQQKIPSYRANDEAHTTVSYLPVLIVDEAWVMMAQIDSSTAFEQLKKGDQTALVFTLLVMGGAIVVTLMVLRFTLQPLRDLRRRAEAMVVELTGKRPVRAAGGDIVSLVSILDTLTALLLERNRELTEQRADLRISAAAFESQEAMMITDANLEILRVNAAFTRITGYSAEEVVGCTPSLFSDDRQDAGFIRQMWENVGRTGSWQGELLDWRKNGEAYPKWLTVSAVNGAGGTVSHYIISHSDISERKRAEQRIEELAFFDPLTCLPNRKLLLDRLRKAITVGNRNGSFGALLFIDLDDFKTLNDTLGHDQGDLLLQQVSQRLVACVRASDTVARLGGDEFVVVLGSLGSSAQEAAKHAEVVGESILSALDHTYQLGALDQRSSASIGAALFGGHESSIDELLKHADLAMYKAKNLGRNVLCFFDPAMQASVIERVDLETDLRRALAANQFVLHYQPQVDGSSRITGAEVLVRWRHPERGMVSPAAFIPLAEETGLILPLGHWVMETACAQLACWAERPETARLTIAVNVSARQFRHPDFVSQVLSLLTSSGADPQRLKLELTESMLVENVEQIIEKMTVLKARGVCFSLDDFGTGYSSLAYLKRLPIEQLKIDQSFVRDLLVDPNDAAIARTIVALAHSLGLSVIAEGVETEAQRDLLASSGCHAYQGYLFSRPLPIESFEQFVQTSSAASSGPTKSCSGVPAETFP